MTERFGFVVAGQSFVVETEQSLGPFVCSYLGASLREPISSATRLVLSWEGDARPDGAQELTTLDGGYLGWASSSETGLVVGMHDPGALGRGIALVISRAFRPPAFMLVHGAGLRDGPNALVAVGVSGAGKSTLATLAEEAALLSDETLVLEVAGGPQVHGTPVRSSSPREITPGSGRLRAILALQKSSEVRLEPLSAQSALALLLEQALTHDPSDLPAQFELAASIVEKVPRYTLHFRKDRDFVPLLMDLLR